MGIHNIDALINDSVVDSHDETDVQVALERETQDGPGPQDPEQLPPSDFEEDE
jgi:hypothetical protein